MHVDVSAPAAGPRSAPPQFAPKAWNISLWLVQALLAVMFGMAGFMKMTAPIAELAEKMAWPGVVPPALVRFIGLSEFAAAIGLILPAATRIKPVLTPLAGAGLGALDRVAVDLERADPHPLAGVAADGRGVRQGGGPRRLGALGLRRRRLALRPRRLVGLVLGLRAGVPIGRGCVAPHGFVLGAVGHAPLALPLLAPLLVGLQRSAFSNEAGLGSPAHGLSGGMSVA